ncbi:MAG: hypothetical protein ACE5GW_11060 [Planctomycetota bacterium]
MSRSALTARRNDDELRRSFLTIAELHLSRGSPQDSKDLWPALERLEDPADRTLLASGRLLRVDHCLTQGHLLLAAEICREAILEFDGDDEPPIAPWIPLLLGRLFEIEGRWLAAIHQYRLAASMFRRIKDPLREARLLIRVGELCRRTGQILESEDSLKRAERLIDRTGAEADRPRLAWNRGLLLARSGWIREARGVLRIAADWGRRFPTTPWSWEVALVEAESSLRSGALDHTRELLEAEAHPSRAPHRHSPETWLRWGLLSTELAMRSARPRAALDVNRLALGEVRERGDLCQQIPLWIARWRILDTLGCVEEAERLAAELTGWLQRYPEHGHAWAAARGELIEDLGACCGDEEDLARFHLSRAHEAAGRGDPGEALFLLEEAHFHARRVRALPLSATIAAHLAMVRRRVFDDSEDPESTLQASWAQLAHAGVVQGRIEILTLWAEARRSAGDEAAAESLERAVERALDRWVVEIPFPHDREILAERMGARHATARHAEQEVEA